MTNFPKDMGYFIFVSSDLDGCTIIAALKVRQSPMTTSIDLKDDRQTMLLLGLVSDDGERSTF